MENPVYTKKMFDEIERARSCLTGGALLKFQQVETLAQEAHQRSMEDGIVGGSEVAAVYNALMAEGMLRLRLFDSDAPRYYGICWSDGRRVTISEDSSAVDEVGKVLTDEELGKLFRQFAIDQIKSQRF